MRIKQFEEIILWLNDDKSPVKMCYTVGNGTNPGTNNAGETFVKVNVNHALGKPVKGKAWDGKSKQLVTNKNE